MSLSCSVFEILSLISQNLKRSHYSEHSLLGIIYALVLLSINQHTRFELSNFINSKDVKRGNILKTRNTFCGTWYLPHSRVHKSILNCAHSNRIRILFSVHVVMYMYCLKILSEYGKVTRLFKPLPRYRNF